MNVLIVDDEEFVTFLLRDVFRRRGHGAYAASSCAEAIKLAQMQAFDLVLTDLYMPAGDGLRVIQKLKALPKTKRAIFLVMSAIPNPDAELLCKGAGAAGFLVKPNQLADIVYAVEGYADHVEIAQGRSTSKMLVRPPHQADKLKRGKLPTKLTRKDEDGDE